MGRGVPFVATGEPIMCTMGSAFTTIKATSQQVKHLAGQRQATDADKIPPKFLENPACFGACSATGGKPCQAMIAIADDWQKTDTHYSIKGQHPLTVASQLPCSKGGIIKFQYLELTTVIEHAMVANHSYYIPGVTPEEDKPDLPPDVDRLDFKDYPEDLQKAELWKDEDSGFRAYLYKKGDEYIIAFRGTETYKLLELIKDGEANLDQGIGLTEEQYKKANHLAKELRKSSFFNQVSITGHSLGGGLASLAGAQTQISTYTFNAAGVHRNTLARNGLIKTDASHVQAYFSDDDALSLAQDNRKLLLVLTPSSLRYGPKGAEAGGPIGKAVGSRVGEMGGELAEVPNELAGQLLEWSGQLDQSMGSILERSTIPAIKDLGTFMREAGGVQIKKEKSWGNRWNLSVTTSKYMVKGLEVRWEPECAPSEARWEVWLLTASRSLNYWMI